MGNDDDLIRRGDALKAVNAVFNGYPNRAADAIAAVPAVTVGAIIAKVPTRYQTVNGDRLLHESDILAALEPVTPAPDAEAIREAAKFLIDRLNEYENEAWMREEESREWCGKVQPAKARLTALITEKPHDRA